MSQDLSQIVARRMAILTPEDQQKILDLVEELSVEKKPGLLERLLTLADGIPDNELSQMPTDGSYNLDHYLYGTKKKPVR